MAAEDGFPLDEYTPHGYLANPGHTWRLRPLGVLRSVAPVGFGWYFPNHPGPYNRKWIYAAALRIGVRIDGRRLLTTEDFAAAGISPVAPYHSSRLVRFSWTVEGIAISAAFCRVEDDVLGCLVRLFNTGDDRSVELLARIDYARNVQRSLLWEHDLYRRNEERIPVLGVYPEGTAVALGALDPPRSVEDVDFDLPGLPAAVSDATFAADYPRAALEATWSVSLPAAAAVSYPFVLARQESSEAAVTWAIDAVDEVAAAERAAVQDDRRFWQLAPQLLGDWPEHWRRGAVYDLETLRLVVKSPTGIFRGPWDGMQQQVPRLVLAEAGLDAVLIGYADPRLAQVLLLTAFRDAPDANVPCCREDGSYNMIAVDGEGCGTAPEWCYPFWCAELLWRRTRDDSFLQALYPLAGQFLNWWLLHRTDADGWLHYHCSWESGQDTNPRFGEQLTGGELTTHIRPSDLHAAVAQCAAILAGWAARLDRPRDAQLWRRVARAYTRRTQSFWHAGWFEDVDTRTGAPSPVRDVMQLAAAFCETTTPAQMRSLAQHLDDVPGHGGQWLPIEWAPVALTTIESAWLLGRRDLVARFAFELADHVYRFSDARRPEGSHPLPGVACEHWSRTGGGWGAEGYGWGALTLMAVIRWILGYREEPQGFILSPCLPDSWLERGCRYDVVSLPVGLPPSEGAVEPLGSTGRVDVQYHVTFERQLEITVTFKGTRGREFVVRALPHPERARRGAGPAIARGRRRVRFTGRNFDAWRIECG